MDEISDSVQTVDQPGESGSSESEDEVLVRRKIPHVRDCIETHKIC